MNKKEVISFLKEAKQTPSNRAVERCIASLPENKKPIRLLPLVKIQLASMPAGVYISAIAAVVFQIILTVSLHPLDALMVTGIFSALVAMMFGWHLMLSSVGSMIEVEKSCKYSYGQILMARLLCVSGLTLTVMLAAIIPNAEICRIGIPFILAAILPTIIGSLAALLWANYIGNSNFAQMAVYLVATLITGLMLKRIVEAGIILLCLILLTTIAVLFIVVFSPYIQRGRVSKLVPVLQETIAAGVTIAVHTKEAESHEEAKQLEHQEMLARLRDIGVQVTTHQTFQQRCAIIDEKIVWYGSVDFLAYGRRDSDALRFVDSDTAGEFLVLHKEAPGEQMMIEEV